MANNKIFMDSVKLGDRISVQKHMNTHDIEKRELSDTKIAFSEAALPYDLHILRSLRKIIRAIDLYSQKLEDTCGLTAPQLMCLMSITRNKKLTAIELARRVRISPSSLVGILDRLEQKGLIARERNHSDRREIFIMATKLGAKTASQAPSPLQDNLAVGLKKLPEKKRANIARSLNLIVDLMEAKEIEAAPLLTLEGRSYAKQKTQRPRK
jgi:DNA-binding MarR family transcriptional regulator